MQYANHDSGHDTASWGRRRMIYHELTVLKYPPHRSTWGFQMRAGRKRTMHDEYWSNPESAKFSSDT